MEEKTTNELLEKEIRSQIGGLGILELGSEKLNNAVSDVATLYKLKIEEQRIAADVEDKAERRRLEEEKLETEKFRRLDEQACRDIQQQEAKKDRYIKIALGSAELILPLIFYGCWMRKGFKFEQTGAFTSTTFRGLFNKFRPTKK
ncbi:MAG: hypothetical protein LIO96_11780 [Lachnospiraceae bacterium]|nr:hypothetical protein [Lachnospiraceae bacterium]